MLRLVTCSTPETVWQPISASNPGFCLLAVVGNSYLTGLGKSSSSYARSFRRRTLTGEVKARGCQTQSPQNYAGSIFAGRGCDESYNRAHSDAWEWWFAFPKGT